jgi:putative membrane protein
LAGANRPPCMKLIFWIVGVPLLLLAVVFAVANREAVSVSLWPFSDTIELPLYLAIVLPLYVGVLLGAVVAWLSGYRARARARSDARRAAALERENVDLKLKLEAALSARRPPAATAEPIPAQPGTSLPSFLP